MVVVNIFIQQYAEIKIFIHFIIPYYICLILNRKSGQFGGRIYEISGRKNDGFNKDKENKKSLKPSHINGFKDFICGTPEGIRTPDLLVRSQTLYPTELPARNTLLNCKYTLYAKAAVWFVARHSIQLSYQRIHKKQGTDILCLVNIPQQLIKCNTFYIII